MIPDFWRALREGQPLLREQPAEPSEERICEGCGCSDNDACVDDTTGHTCGWVAQYDGNLCTFCGAAALAAMERDGHTDLALALAGIREESKSLIEVVSPNQAQLYIEQTRAARMGGGL